MRNRREGSNRRKKTSNRNNSSFCLFRKLLTYATLLGSKCIFSEKDIFYTFDIECLFCVIDLLFVTLFDSKKLRKDPFLWKKYGVRWVFLIVIGVNVDNMVVLAIVSLKYTVPVEYST